MSFVSRQFMKKVSFTTLGTFRNGFKVNIHFPGATRIFSSSLISKIFPSSPKCISRRVIVILNHTFDVVKSVLIVGDVLGSAAMINISLTLSGTMLTPELELVSGIGRLKYVFEESKSFHL